MKSCLMILNNLTLSGAPHTFLHLIDALSGQYEIHLQVTSVLCDKDRYLLDAFESRCRSVQLLSVNIYDRVHKLYPYYGFRDISEYVKKNNPDLIITNIVSVAADLSGLKCVEKGRLVFYSLGEKGSYSRFLLPRMIHTAQMKRLAEKATVIGVSDMCFSPFFPYENEDQVLMDYPDVAHSYVLKTPENKPEIVLGQIGYFCDLKNQLFSLRVLKRLLSDGYDCRLRLIGYYVERTKKYYEKMCAYIRENDLTDRVDFLEKDYDKLAFFDEIDCLLFPSLSEGLGIVALEAQYRQTPCIAGINLPKSIQLGGVVFETLEEDRWADIIRRRQYVIREPITVDLKKKFTEKAMKLFCSGGE